MPDEANHSDDPLCCWAPLDSAEWYAARDAAIALRDVLTSAGLEREFPFLRADLNAFGHGLIELGRVSPETAQRLADLLSLGLAAVQDPQAIEGEQPT
ncbi:hypothetical protein [Streptomyces sp. CA-111067]|uniref:hypothetical protein n=1 Tax=Streptomyces sp. CA-111067 TaxID=3240046 RepID=UPI003D966130